MGRLALSRFSDSAIFALLPTFIVVCDGSLQTYGIWVGYWIITLFERRTDEVSKL